MNLTENSKYFRVNLWHVVFLVIFVPLLLLITSNSPQIMWNSVRSFYAVAAFDGLSTYPGVTGKGIFGQYYPPLGWLLYSPIGIFENPTTIITSASVLNISCVLIALFSVFHWKREQIESTAFLLFSLSLWLLHPSTFYIISMVHIDAPALALVIISCCILERNKLTLSPRSLFYSALFLSLSVWVKQVMILALFGQLIVILIRHNIKTVFLYFFLVAITLIGVGMLMSSLYGWQQLYFHIFELPSQTHYLPIIATASRNVVELFPAIIFSIILIIITSTFSRSPNNFRQFDDIKIWFADNECVYFLVIALILVPISFLARMRYGGDLNSLICIPFFILCICLSIQNWYIHNQASINKVFAALILLALISTTLVSVGLSYPSNDLRMPVTTTWNRIIDSEARKNNPTEAAFNYINTSTGNPYFPLYPLASWLAKKELTPYTIAQCERELILGLEEEKNRFSLEFKTLPSEILYFRIDQQHCDKNTYIHQKYFPETFQIKQASKIMSGWDIFLREPN